LAWAIYCDGFKMQASKERENVRERMRKRTREIMRKRSRESRIYANFIGFPS
jgi:hypothetical protein